MRWVPYVLSLEMRKLMSYRVDFWITFAVSVVGELLLAYYLWGAIFQTRGVQQLGGYTFQGILFYYLLVPLVGRMIRANELGLISEDIYQGTLTRYLVYPVSFFNFKWVGHLGHSLLSVVQLAGAVAFYFALFGVPEGVELSPWAFAQGFLAALSGATLYFTLASLLELIAFWADGVWSFVVMLRFAVQLLGGGFLPLSFFPEGFARVLELLPFSFLASFPIRCFMGQVGPEESVRGLLLAVFWTVVLRGIWQWVWSKGTREYTGVGI